MDDEGTKELTRHEDASLPGGSENPEALLNGEQKDDERPPDTGMGCLWTILLTVVLVTVSIFLVCLISVPTFR